MPCETCADEKYTGIRWPVDISGNTDHGWIERCDECDLYADDIEAASYLARMEGYNSFGFGLAPLGDTVQPFYDRPKNRWANFTEAERNLIRGALESFDVSYRLNGVEVDLEAEIANYNPKED